MGTFDRLRKNHRGQGSSEQATESDHNISLIDESTVVGRLETSVRRICTLVSSAGNNEVPPVVKAMNLALPMMMKNLRKISDADLREYCLKFVQELKWVANGDTTGDSTPESGEGILGWPVGVRQVNASGEADRPVLVAVPDEPNPDNGHETPVHAAIPVKRPTRRASVPKVGSRGKNPGLDAGASGDESVGSVEALSDSDSPDR